MKNCQINQNQIFKCCFLIPGNSVVVINSPKLSACLKKGIPDEYRAEIWTLISGVVFRVISKADYYNSILNNITNISNDSVFEEIEKVAKSQILFGLLVNNLLLLFLFLEPTNKYLLLIKSVL